MAPTRVTWNFVQKSWLRPKLDENILLELDTNCHIRAKVAIKRLRKFKRRD
jgi:hypothetical protein